MGELLTKRLTLRPTSAVHLPHLTALYAEAAVGAGTRYKRALDPSEAAALLDEYRLNWRDHGYGMYALLRRDDNVYVGECGLRLHDRTDGPALRYAVASAHWGQGYAVEAARAVLSWAFETRGLGAVDAFVRADNMPSRRVLDLVGVPLAEEIEVGGPILLRYRAERGRWS